MVAELTGKMDILSRLNDEQRKAVCLSWGPALVIAGAGSGKTTVLTRRIAYLISELRQDPSEILAVTFTNKAAAEMKARVETIVGPELARRSWIGTFHSICARILRREIENYESQEGLKWSRNFVIYDEVDSRNLIKQIVKTLNLDEKVFAPKEMKHAISALKNDGFTAHLYSGESKSYREGRISDIFNAYQKELSRNNALDFDDLILVFTELLKQNPVVRRQIQARFRHVLIDEFQDTNKAQYDMVRLMTDPADNRDLRFTDENGFHPDRWNERSLMVVGDVDQSIYSWRKADYRIFLGFQHDYKGAEVIKLEENYRSTESILEIANSIIENNTERIEKVLRCNRGKGSKAQFYEASDEIDEAFYVIEELKRLKLGGRKHADSVILYRTNAQTRAIEEVLIRSAIPYTVIGATKFYDRQEIKDVIAYLKLVYNPDDGQAFARVINTPKRGIGKSSLERLQEYAASRSMSNVQAAALAEQVPNLPPKAKAALKEFSYFVLNRWRPEKSESISKLLELILRDIKYMEMLEEEANSSRDELAYGRIENIREFLAVAKEFEEIADEPDLESFLTRISLVSDLDQMKMEEDAVKLMTLHSAKGLEFPVVFLMGLEEGLFPHMRSFDSPTAMEEERRLMYVGVTRAEDKLYMTRARKRTTINRNASNSSGFSTNSTIASRFLQEIKPGLVVGYFPTESRSSYDDDRGSRNRWDDSNEYSSYSDSDDDFSGTRGSRYGGDQGNSYAGGGSRYGGNEGYQYGGGGSRSSGSYARGGGNQGSGSYGGGQS
ncbi:MAG: UvrD-helicase domain-containing protein, partial [Cyanobacteria bacterium]|nr:UvrD-helicase domain-containing protein [Cyanobacteriota bacterium]